MLREAFARRILVLDGAMGTMIQARGLSAEDFGGAQYEGCNEYLNVTRPDVIRDIHLAYLDAGAHLISTNTFGTAPYVLAEYDLLDRCYEITLAAARIARAAVDSRSTAEDPRFLLGAMGPGTRTITVTGGVTFDEVTEAYRVQAAALIEGGVDALLLETCQDTLQRQGRGDRAPAGDGRRPRRAADDGVRHDRADGHDARRPERRRAAGLARAPRRVLDRAQLRHRPRVHDRPPAVARRARPVAS